MTKLEWALKHAAKGFRVFPIAENGKVPNLKNWPELASREPEQIRQWWKYSPDSNIGILTGEICADGRHECLVVVDLDEKDGRKGIENFDRLVKEREGAITPTLITKTPTNGRHLFFTLDRPAGNSAGKLADGVDIRGVGGYVLAPGSTIAGKPYRVESSAPIAACPEWLSGLLSPPGKAKSDLAETARIDGVDTERAVNRAITYLEGEAPIAIEGQGGDAQTFRVAARVKDMGCTAGQCFQLMAEHWNERCAPPWELGDLRAKVNNAYAYGAEQPGIAAPEAEFKPVHAPAPTGAPGLNLVVTCVADVQAKPINWLWPETFAYGKTSMIAGIPGLGKSQLTISLAAAVSTGGTLPSGHRCERGDVVLITAEDAIDDTIRPRLEAAGADLRRIRVIESVRTERNGQEGVRGFNIQADVQQLRLLAGQLPELRLVVIDPVSAFLGGADSHNNSEVRALLSPLGKFAEEAGAAVLMVSHLNKGSGPASGRVTGSGAFTAAPRAAYIVVKHPEDDLRLIMTPLKNNIGDSRTSWVFEVESVPLQNGIKSSRVKWLGKTEAVTAEEALEKKVNHTPARKDAETFLVTALQDGPKARSEVYDLARERGISEITLRRASKALGVLSRKEQGIKHGGFQWFMPERKPDKLPLSAAEIFGD